MTFHEAASVFLIIGAAVLGPFEGKDLSNIDVVHGCVRAHGIEPGTPMVAAPESCPRITVARETTAETCKRILREIGAKKGGQKVDGLHPEIYQYFEYGQYVEGQRVLCIPAPTGLVR